MYAGSGTVKALESLARVCASVDKRGLTWLHSLSLLFILVFKSIYQSLVHVPLLLLILHCVKHTANQWGEEDTVPHHLSLELYATLCDVDIYRGDMLAMTGQTPDYTNRWMYLSCLNTWGICGILAQRMVLSSHHALNFLNFLMLLEFTLKRMCSNDR